MCKAMPKLIFSFWSTTLYSFLENNIYWDYNYSHRMEGLKIPFRLKIFFIMSCNCKKCCGLIKRVLFLCMLYYQPKCSYKWTSGWPYPHYVLFQYCKPCLLQLYSFIEMGECEVFQFVWFVYVNMWFKLLLYQNSLGTQVLINCLPTCLE